MTNDENELTRFKACLSDALTTAEMNEIKLCLTGHTIVAYLIRQQNQGIVQRHLVVSSNRLFARLENGLFFFFGGHSTQLRLAPNEAKLVGTMGTK